MLGKIFKALGILQKAGDSTSSEIQNAARNKSSERNLELGGLIIEVAREFEDRNRFKEVAKDVACKL